MAIPDTTGEKLLARILRGELPSLIRPAAPGGRDLGSHPPVTEDVITAALETVADEPGGGIPGILPGRIDQELADNSITYIIMGAVISISRAIIDYHCIRDGDTEWGMVDLALMDDGSTVNKISEPRWDSSESGCGLTFAGDVSGGNLRLKITTSNTGAAADFRASYRTITA